MQNKRYPDIHIRSKNELAKRLIGKKLNQEQALTLINDVLLNFDKYWKDHPRLSKPAEEKWVRNASYTNLGKLLKLINLKVLAPYDDMLPNFLFGGIAGRNHKAAVEHLLGDKRGRVLLKLDISRFYERISQQRVEQFFGSKVGCSEVSARLLARLSCVPFGAKVEPAEHNTLARGFATSSRLAVWCNLDTFVRLERLVQKELRGKDPRISIYVDDIGITASRVTKEDMMRLYTKVQGILATDAKQPLPLNVKKTKIVFHDGRTFDIDGNYLGKWSFEILGIQMRRTTLVPGARTRWKIADVLHKVKISRSLKLKKTKKALAQYKSYIERP